MSLLNIVDGPIKGIHNVELDNGFRSGSLLAVKFKTVIRDFEENTYPVIPMIMSLVTYNGGATWECLSIHSTLIAPYRRGPHTGLINTSDTVFNIMVSIAGACPHDSCSEEQVIEMYKRIVPEENQVSDRKIIKAIHDISNESSLVQAEEDFGFVIDSTVVDRDLKRTNKYTSIEEFQLGFWNKTFERHLS